MTTVAQIAAAIHVDEADVRYLISTMDDLHDDDVPADVITAVHTTLNPRCERTVPELYGYALDDL